MKALDEFHFSMWVAGFNVFDRSYFLSVDLLWLTTWYLAAQVQKEREKEITDDEAEEEEEEKKKEVNS